MVTDSTIGLIDYGLGNIFSVENALKILGVQVVVATSPSMLDGVDKIILPGVGNFSDGMQNLNNLGFSDYIRNYVVSGGYILGICLGMQLFLRSSIEGGYSKGLGIIDGEVKLLKPVNLCLVPHIGWNVLNGIDMDKISIFNDISPDSTCYFVHSYHANIGNNIKRVYTNYCGIKIIAAYCKNNIYAVQFHPEKSQNIGLKILKNFIEI